MTLMKWFMTKREFLFSFFFLKWRWNVTGSIKWHWMLWTGCPWNVDEFCHFMLQAVFERNCRPKQQRDVTSVSMQDRTLIHCGEAANCTRTTWTVAARLPVIHWMSVLGVRAGRCRWRAVDVWLCSLNQGFRICLSVQGSMESAESLWVSNFRRQQLQQLNNRKITADILSNRNYASCTKTK